MIKECNSAQHLEDVVKFLQGINILMYPKGKQDTERRFRKLSYANVVRIADNNEKILLQEDRKLRSYRLRTWEDSIKDVIAHHEVVHHLIEAYSVENSLFLEQITELKVMSMDRPHICINRGKSLGELIPEHVFTELVNSYTDYEDSYTTMEIISLQVRQFLQERCKTNFEMRDVIRKLSHKTSQAMYRTEFTNLEKGDSKCVKGFSW